MSVEGIYRPFRTDYQKHATNESRAVSLPTSQADVPQVVTDIQSCPSRGWMVVHCVCQLHPLRYIRQYNTIQYV